MSKEYRVCKYAWDKDDEYCSKCDGLNIYDEQTDKTYPAPECGGYEESDEVNETKPVDKVVEPKNEPAEQTQTHAVADELGAHDVQTELQGVYTSKAITTSIKAESGVTVTVSDKSGNSSWYKFTYSEERIVPESADLEKEKDLLWNAVNDTVDRQVEMVVDPK